MDACALAVHYSKAKEVQAVDIYCTQVKYLRRVKDTVGKVTMLREKTLTYRVESARIRDILNSKE